MLSVPQPKNLMSVVGTGIDQKFDYGGSSGSEEESLKNIVKSIESFEVGHGYQSDGIKSYGSSDYIDNDVDFDEPTQHQDIDRSTKTAKTTQDKDIDESEPPIDLEHDIKGYEKLDDGSILIETFNGSKIIEEEERILVAKCICIAILFVIVNYTKWDKKIMEFLGKLGLKKNVNIIVVKAIIFGILFYMTEKYLLK